MPLSPDYGESAVCYADGVFDPHFSRYISIMEGSYIIPLINDSMLLETGPFFNFNLFWQIIV